MLRADGPLKDLASMRSYCYRNGGEITEDGRCYGYVVDTEHCCVEHPNAKFSMEVRI